MVDSVYLDMFRLDRNAFKAQTAGEASEMHRLHYQKMSWQERLEVANYLNSIAYGYVGQDIPKMDRAKFAVRSRNNG